MSVSKISKVTLTVITDVYDDVMDVLHGGGYMEIEQWKEAEAPEVGPEESRAGYWLSNVTFALDLLKEYAPEEKKSLKEKLAAEKPAVSEAELKSLAQEFDYKAQIKELENLEKELNTVKNTISALRKDRAKLRSWAGAPVIAEQETRYVTFRAVSLPVARYEAFTTDCAEKKNIEITRISEQDQEVFCIVAFTRELTDELIPLFELHEVKEAENIIGVPQSVDERLEMLESDMRGLEGDRDALEEKIKLHAGDIPKFQMLFDYLSWKADQDEALHRATASKETISLIGWIPSNRIEALRKQLDAVTTSYVLQEIEPEAEEQRPVFLQNKSFIEPFESVTEVYGAPQYSEPDPTVLLAPFFIVYFALCLTDAGYGIVLSVLAFVALKLMKPKGGAKKLMTLMAIGGIFTFIIGALFGGWFGIVLNDLPEGPLKQGALALRLIDPVANPMGVLVLSFILGFIQMVVANVIDAVWKIKQGMALDGILGSGVWALFLSIIGFWVAGIAGVLPEGLAQLATYLLYAGIVMMVLTQGRGQKNIFLKFGMGVFSLYGLVGYLSDILSYSRLLALGLSTGIIAMVVNLVADLFAGMVPFVGPLVWILIIIGGHLFNLAINVLGAYIHAGRLQFVEYFPKFMEGGGRKFKPLVRSAKYVSVKN